MPEPVRAYALERLAESGELADAQRRQAAFFDELVGAEAAAEIGRLEFEHGHLGAVMRWSRDPTAAPSPTGSAPATATAPPRAVPAESGAPPPAGASPLADSVAQFSGVQGLHDWYYGYYEPPFTSDTFKLATTVLPAGGSYAGVETWKVEPSLHLWADGGHPNGFGVSQWAVRLWVSRVTGGVTITGRLAKLDTSGGDGVVGLVLVDGAVVWSRAIAAADDTGVTYSVTAPVGLGSAVDFALSPGPAGHHTCDSSLFTARIAAAANRAPTVDAGPDQTIVLPEAARLAPTVEDDGLPHGGRPTVRWSQVSGPGTATFFDAGAAHTMATFSALGTYVLRLSASDGELTADDELTVTVEALRLPPDPAALAPPVETGVGTTPGAAPAFLYGGPDPIQRGVAPGTIEPRRAAVLRGRVWGTSIRSASRGASFGFVDQPAEAVAAEDLADGRDLLATGQGHA
jgi:hypothetical protein